MIGFNYYGLGRKKNSICRTFMKVGKGIFIVNNKNLLDYFRSDRINIFKIFVSFELINLFNFDIDSKLKGGGCKSQIDSLSISICKAILDYNIVYLKLFRNLEIFNDNRIVERKKIGLKKSRKKKQFSKR